MSSTHKLKRKDKIKIYRPYCILYAFLYLKKNLIDFSLAYSWSFRGKVKLDCFLNCSNYIQNRSSVIILILICNRCGLWRSKLMSWTSVAHHQSVLSDNLRYDLLLYWNNFICNLISGCSHFILSNYRVGLQNFQYNLIILVEISQNVRLKKKKNRYNDRHGHLIRNHFD